MKRTRRQALILIGSTVTGTFALQEYARRKEPTDYPTDTDSEIVSEEATSRAQEPEETEPEASVEILGVESHPIEWRGGEARSVDSVRVYVGNTGGVPFAPRAEAQSRVSVPNSDRVRVATLGTHNFEALEPGEVREARIRRTNAGVVPPGRSVPHVVRLIADGEEVASDEVVVEA